MGRSSTSFTSERAKEIGRRGGQNKGGKKHLRTLIREKLNLNWDDAEKLFEENVIESMSSKNKKERLQATRYFGDYIKARKRELSGNVTLTFEDYLKQRKQAERE